MKARRPGGTGRRDAPIGPAQGLERAADARRLVGDGGVDEGAIPRLGNKPQVLGVIARDHNLIVLIALGHRDIALLYRDRAALRRPKAHGHDDDAILRRARGGGAHLAGVFEGFAVAHEDQRPIARRLGRE